MDRLPAHFRQGPSQWNDIGNFINNRPKSDAKAHYRAFRDFLRQIHGTPEAGDLEKRTALELLSTVTLPDFQIQTCLKKQRAAVQAAENAKEKLRANSFASAAALIVHAEDELVKDITKERPSTISQSEELVRKRARTETLEVASSSSFCEPWGSLMKIMHEILRHGRSDTPMPSGDGLCLTRKVLYTYIRAHLEDTKTALQHEKDLLVALSGVINLRAANIKDMFGTRLINDIERAAPRVHPDDSIRDPLQMLKEILTKYGIQYLRDEISIMDAERVGKVRRGEQVHPLLKIALDVVRFLVDKIITGTFGESEHAVVSTWKTVFDFISEGLLKFETGEPASDATKEIRVLQEHEFSGTSKSVCGRKMDLHLHLDALVLNNSEFKAVGVDIEENKRQSRKNIRINKAILVYLQRHVKFELDNGDYMVFLDVSGYTGTIVYLRWHEGVHVSGLLSQICIRLPLNEKDLKAFLGGQSLGWLLTYVQHLRSMQQKVEDARTQAVDESFLRQERTILPLEQRDLDSIVMNTPKKKGNVR